MVYGTPIHASGEPTSPRRAQGIGRARPEHKLALPSSLSPQNRIRWVYQDGGPRHHLAHQLKPLGRKFGRKVPLKNDVWLGVEWYSTCVAP